MKKDMSRREMIGIGSVAGLTLLGAGISGYAVGTSPKPSDATFPWSYKKLKEAKTAERGYGDYFVAGCMYGVFESIVGQLADKHGEPYSTFPMAMTSYGGGGIASWGSVCGCLNGAASAIAMFHTGADRSALINELFAWYERTKLPVYQPASPIRSSKKIKKSKASSVLCHASVSNWSEASGYDGFSPERAERCGRLVADVAAKTVELLNAMRKGQFVPAHPIKKPTTVCLSCHGRGNSPGGTLSKMTCTSCHEGH